jgi:hypothetical protein
MLTRRPLTCEHRRHELGAIDDRVEPALQEPDEIGARVALHPQRFDIVLVELALGDVAVIALELLLRLQLGAEVGGFALAALAMLAGAVFALVERAARATPDVLAHPAVDFVFGFGALRHRGSSGFVSGNAPSCAPTPAQAARKPGRQASAEQGECRGCVKRRTRPFEPRARRRPVV